MLNHAASKELPQASTTSKVALERIIKEENINSPSHPANARKEQSLPLFEKHFATVNAKSIERYQLRKYATGRLQKGLIEHDQTGHLHSPGKETAVCRT